MISAADVRIQDIKCAYLSVLPIIDHNTRYNIESAPRFIRGPSDGIALAGNTVTLDAYFEGYPEPEITWLRAVIKLLFNYVIL